MTATTAARRLPQLHRRASVSAAVVSIVTMPLTAMWFLLIGGALLVGGLVAAIVRNTAELGVVGSVGLGLLAGPAIYLALALVQ